MNANILDLIGSFSAPTSDITGQMIKKEYKNNTPSNEEALKTRSSGAFTAVIFSKDRPFQLHSLLTSMEKFFSEAPRNIYVLYTSSIQWVDHYEAVFRFFSKTVTPILETNFALNLEECLGNVGNGPNSGFIMLCVDDLLFYDTVSLREITQHMNTHPELYGIHLKLHPGICYSHAGSCASPPPQLTPIGGEVLGFDHRCASADWAYPFDLCACVYRSSDVALIIEQIKDRLGDGGMRNPNLLEMSGNQVMTSGKDFSQFTLGGCLTRPVCSVVTVNKVQATFDVPIYSTAGGDLASLNALMRPLLSGTSSRVAEYDHPRYKTSTYTSVHIEDLYLLDPLETPSALSTTNDIEVCVLLPIWNGADLIPRCLKSLLRQTHGRFQVICILNGCTDSSEAACSSFVDLFAARAVTLTVLVLPQPGLAAALRVGVEAAEGARYVCRVDVDDVVVSARRLADQVQFLEAHPLVHVVGTQGFLAAETGEECRPSSVAAGIPTHPALVQWEMIFRCVVLHPTVMFRREVIASCGSYGNHLALETNCAEDYMLWTQVLLRHPFGVVNMASVDTCLLQHPASKSVRERETALDEAVHVQWSLARPLLGRHGDFSLFSSEENVFSLFSKIGHPDEVSSAAEARSVCRLIRALHQSYLLSVPLEHQGKDVKCLLKESMVKVVIKFLAICALKFSIDCFRNELSVLEVSPALLLKYQLSRIRPDDSLAFRAMSHSHDSQL